MTGPEHQLVRLPLIAKLIELGWKDDQLQWTPEWKVPKTPHDASKREKGHSFDGFPVDLVAFASPDQRGEVEHIRIIFETKEPDETVGVDQLEVYMGHEPRVRAGYWTNGTLLTAVYRLQDGTFQREHISTLPGPNDLLLHTTREPLLWRHLQATNTRDLAKRLQRLLEIVVAQDARVTEPETRLNQLCNLILVKLESDRRAKAKPSETVLFQTQATAKATAKSIRDFYQSLKLSAKDVFSQENDRDILFADETIHEVCFELAAVKLIDAGFEVVSSAFQVFRSPSRKAEDGQYFTPPRIVHAAIRALDLDYGDTLIDPACGTGGFLLQAFRVFREKHPGMSESDVKAWAQQHIYGVDKSAVGVKLAKAMMMILGDGSAHTFIGDSIARQKWPESWPHLVPVLKPESFTCVATNPPFGKKLKVSRNDARLASLTICQKPIRMPDGSFTFDAKTFQEREIGLAFLELSWRLLVAGGRVAIVLPETYFFSSSYLWLFDWLQGKLTLRGVLNVPMEAFQGFCRAKTNIYIFEKVGLNAAPT